MINLLLGCFFAQCAVAGLLCLVDRIETGAADDSVWSVVRRRLAAGSAAGGTS